MYVTISTDNQTGWVLGEVKEKCGTLDKARTASKGLNTNNGNGVIRKLRRGSVSIGEMVGFCDTRLEEVV